jgi:hypothetical protein
MYGLPQSKPDYQYNGLTSLVILELNFSRKERYLAWWMHEMAVTLMTRRQKASESLMLAEGCRTDLGIILRDIGLALTAWHHGKLKSKDFHIPYSLRNHARITKQSLEKVALSCGLTAFTEPNRRRWKRKRIIWSHMKDPNKGIQMIDTLGRFTGFDAVLFGVAFAFARIRLRQTEQFLLQTKVYFLDRKIKRRKRSYSKRR